MEPISEFKSLLTGSSVNEDVNVVRCDHVVPPDNVLGVCVSKGPANVTLNFSYENRMSKELVSRFVNFWNYWSMGFIKNCFYRLCEN